MRYFSTRWHILACVAGGIVTSARFIWGTVAYPRGELGERWALLQWYGHPRVLGIHIAKSLVIWASPPHLILAIMVRVTGDAHITRVLGMGMPTSLWQRPGFHKFRALASLQLFLEHSLAIKVNILSVVTFRLKWGKNGQGYVILSPFNSLTHSPMNRRYGSTSLIPVITPSVLTVLDNFGPSQTSNFSRDEPNSNLGRPKLS